MAFPFSFFRSGFALLAYFILFLSERAVLRSGLMSYLPFHPPTVPGSPVGREGGPESLRREWLSVWFIYVESITAAWPFYLPNRLNPPLPPLRPCVRTGRHHPSPGSPLSLLMASCLLSPSFQFTLHSAAQWYFINVGKVSKHTPIYFWLMN